MFALKTLYWLGGIIPFLLTQTPLIMPLPNTHITVNASPSAKAFQPVRKITAVDMSISLNHLEVARKICRLGARPPFVKLLKYQTAALHQRDAKG